MIDMAEKGNGLNYLNHIQVVRGQNQKDIEPIALDKLKGQDDPPLCCKHC